jgi:anaerobic selenocysteine-containing dehydrogenase
MDLRLRHLAEQVRRYPRNGRTRHRVPAEQIAAARGCGPKRSRGAEWDAQLTRRTPSRRCAISRFCRRSPADRHAWRLAFGIRVPFLPESCSNRKETPGRDRFRVLGGDGSLVPSAHIPAVFKSMLEGDPYWTKGFLVFGNNALSTYADVHKVHEALTRLDFLMVADLFMTPTCELADVVLPVAAWPELDQIVSMPYFGEDVVLAQQRAVQIGECKQDEIIMTELARRLGLLRR